MRTVTVFATKGKRKAKIETDVQVWSELKELVRKEGYDMSTLHATENVNRADLVNDTAKLPDSNFTLFLRPKKTKSGVDYTKMGFKDLRAQLSDEDKVKITEETGKNWTRCSTDDLKEYLTKRDTSGNLPEKTSEQADATEENAVEAGNNNASKISAIVSILGTLETDDEEAIERIQLIKEDVESLEEVIGDEGESAEEKAAREAEEAKIKAEKEEDERLAQEAKELGFM